MEFSKFTPEEVFNHWKDRASQHGTSHTASWNDALAVDLEVKNILTYLENGHRVLDVGCANGHATLRYAMERQIDVHGLDYIPGMIENANLHLQEVTKKLQGLVTFCEGNILDLKEPMDHYDRIIITRVLINLTTPDKQKEALLRCSRSLKKGGLILLSDATKSGWSHLNAFRQEWGLSPLPMPDFNLYLEEKSLLESVSSTLTLRKVVNFSSSYYLGTRVFKPLLVKLLADSKITGLNLTDHWNRYFADLPQAGDYGIQKLFVLEKL